jgi:F0F1-type ATP synthase membrane subunit c/vacuolar-type H+-ATPase subunit K
VILRSGEVESERGRTVEALAGFIGAGVGRGTGLAGRGVVRVGLSARGVLWCARTRRTRGRLFLPVF